MAQHRILVAEDDIDIREMLQKLLLDEGYDVTAAADGRQAFALLARQIDNAHDRFAESDIDLVISDLMMPRMTGYQLCASIRKNSMLRHIPILMLTVSEKAESELLDLGADDFIAKPIDAKRLLARVRALLRRAGAAGQSLTHLTKGCIDVEIETRTVKADGQAVELSRREFDLLVRLMRAPGVLKRGQIADTLSKSKESGLPLSVDKAIERLRARLGVGAKHIVTRRGIGYQFAENL